MKLNRAFTLIELIIVISIISLLAMAGLYSYSAVRQDSRNAKRKADLREVQKVLEAYKSRNGSYPATASGSTHESGHYWRGTCSNYGGMADSGATGYIPDLAPRYMPKLPRDPRENNGHLGTGATGCANAGANCYLYISNGSDYKFIAHCTPEGTMSAQDQFYDNERPTWAWQVSSSAQNTLDW